MIQQFRPEPPTDFQAILDMQDPDLRMLAALCAFRMEKRQEQKAQKYDRYLDDLREPLVRLEARKAREREHLRKPWLASTSV
jgi:hypothetical protein